MYIDRGKYVTTASPPPFREHKKKRKIERRNCERESKYK
jgi:hypothetical protein